MGHSPTALADSTKGVEMSLNQSSSVFLVGLLPSLKLVCGETMHLHLYSVDLAYVGWTSQTDSGTITILLNVLAVS